MEESWLVTSGDLAKKPAKGGMSVAPMLLIAGVIVVLVVAGPKDGAPPPAKPVSYAPSVGEIGAKVIGKIGQGTWRQDFKSPDLSSWLSASGAASVGADVEGWMAKAGSVYPGKLRLWQPTQLLADYQLNFGAAIENKAVGWAYRAANSENYYATKLIVTDSSRSEISRWAVVEGDSLTRVQLPIPITLIPGKDYQVHVRVQGNRFTTFVDNQLIDTWTDSKLAKGGVGFFSEPGERAAVRWVDVVQEETGGLGGLFKFGFYLPVLPQRLPVASLPIR